MNRTTSIWLDLPMGREDPGCSHRRHTWGCLRGPTKPLTQEAALLLMGCALGRGGAHCLVLKPLRGSFPGGTSGKEPACQCRRCKRYGFDPWMGKIPWRRAWQPTPVFLPGESPWTEEPGGLQSTGSQGVGHGWVTEHTHTRMRALVILSALTLWPILHWV